MDIVTSYRRSQIMAGIRSKDTQPELIVRRVAHSMGLRFRLHRRDLPGSPDLVFPRWRLAVFVHGCFWHRHEGCRLAAQPKTRPEFWRQKFEANIRRDRGAIDQLTGLGWRVEVIWECETRNPVEVASRLSLATTGR
ncbi:DNA mismatch endonuclease Vsr [Rhodanobacter hydrolyticus]|uniref:Very short patch repair endonuclease n=1 Tax=Rhodanobacter hydrolyticus TaxID=2250595 RepID=A0ABW8J8V0_9GAMM